eukprot:g9573.t1
MMGKKMSIAALAGVTVALFASTITLTAAVCSNGLEGIQSTSADVCCVEGCTLCGGVGCTPPNGSALTSADCCTSEIILSGVFCDESLAAPCIVTTEAAPADSVCINGQTGVQDPNTDVCCPLACGTECGGDGCGIIPGVDASQCCASEIIASGVVCDGTVTPCVVVATATDNSTTCSNGLAGIEDPVNLICCDAACGQCGGAGCGSIPGLTGLDCCSDEIEATAELCSVTNAAPCVIDPPAFAPSMCPNGIPGVQDDTVCCAEACNLQCGGVGCGTIVGTNGAEDCCSDTILATGVPCGVGVEAPCIMQNGTYTNAPMAAPTIPPRGTLAPVAAGNATSAPAAVGATSAPAAVGAGATLAPAAAGNGTAGMTEAPVAGSRDFEFTEAPTVAGDVNGDGLVNSADTGIVGDTNGDGVVDGLDTGLVGDTNGDGVVNDLDEDVGATLAPTAAPTGAPAVVAATGAPTATPSAGPTSADGTRDFDLTPAPGDTNGDGVVDANDGVDTNGDGVIDSNDGVDTNGDGVVDSQDGVEAVEATPAPTEAADADAEASGNGAMSTAGLPASSAYFGVVGLAAITAGGVLLL